MTTAEREKPPARRLLGSQGSAATKKSPSGKAAVISKDEAVSAARSLGEEVVRIEVKRFSGRSRKIAEFEMPAIDAADLIERTKQISTSIKVGLQPTPKLVSAIGAPLVGPFKTKKELFDALEAKDEG